MSDLANNIDVTLDRNLVQVSDDGNSITVTRSANVVEVSGVGTQGPSGVAGALNDLSDVTISLPTAKQLLYYTGTIWRNVSLAASDLPDITLAKVTDAGTAAASAVEDFEASGSISTHASLTNGVHGISGFGSTLIDDLDAATARNTLGLGTAATSNTGDFAPTLHTHTLSQITDSGTLAAEDAAALSVSLIPDTDQAYDLGSADYRWADIHGDLDGPVIFRAKISGGGTLAVGDVVYIDGVSGEVPTVAKASASSASTMPAFGIISQGGSGSQDVHVTTLGSLTGIALPTPTYAVGDNVYVSTTAGQFTTSPPTGESNLIQNIGYVAKTHASNGILKVGGAGRTNAVPNLDQNKIFLGNASNQAVSTALSSVNLSSFNNDLTLGANDYIEQPTYTNNQVKLWYDFLNCVPDRLPTGIGPTWWLGAGGSGVAAEDGDISGARGGTALWINGNNDRYTFWGGSPLSGLHESDGDEVFFESRVYFVDSIATAGSLQLGVVDRTAALNYNDAPPQNGYTAFDHATLVVDLSQTYVQRTVKDTGGAGNPTVTDLTSYPVSSYVDTWFRLGIHAKYNAGSSNWDIGYYINGTNVGTASMTFSDRIIPYVGGSVGTSAGTCVVYIDWISMQYKIGGVISGRTTHLSLEDL